MRQLALDSNGLPRRLTKYQQRGIREEGSFAVPSENFPGAVHVWRISQLLQRGRKLANEDLKNLLAIAYEITFITARDRVIGDVFSLKDVGKHIGYSVYFIYNLIIGGQARFPRIDKRNILLKALTAELKTDDVITLSKKKRDILVKTGYANSGVHLRSDQVGHVYRNGEGMNLNIFTVSPCWINSLSGKVLSEIYSKAKDLTLEKFPPQLVKKLITEYQGQSQDMSNKEIEKAIQDRFNVEFLNELINSIKEHPDTNTVIPLGQGGVIDSYFRGLKAVHEAIKEETKRVEEVVKNRREYLENHCSVRFKCDLWQNEQIEKATKSAFLQENSYENVRQKLQSCPNVGPEWEYFLNICEDHYRNLPRTIKRVEKRDYDVQKFHFERYIWIPTNYIVTDGSGKRKRNLKMQSKGSSSGSYSIEYEEEYLVTTKYPGWRWRIFFVSFYTWLLNALFILLFYFILKGPLSLSALFLWYEHPIKYSVDGRTGNLYPYKRGKTLITRLASLWRQILKRREEFESRPDTGFLPKNLTRLINRIYYYIIWGFFGSIILIFGFITLSILTINLAIVLIVTLPLWYALFHVLKISTLWLFYDWQFRFKGRLQGLEYAFIMPVFYLVFYKLLIRIFLQLISVLFILVALPNVSFIIVLYAFARRILRSVWDFFTFHLVIRLRGRVPEADSFLARRVSGPGLATNYFYRIDPNQALVKFEYDLESKEIGLYEDFMKDLIDQPRMVYSQFIQSFLTSFGYSQKQEKSQNVTLKGINSQMTSLQNELGSSLKIRRKSLKFNQPSVALRSIRMNKKDLELTVEVATILIKEFYTKRIIFYPNNGLESVFSVRGLPQGDWESLAKIQLTNSFSQNFLTPLEDSDETFNLEVHKFGLRNYLKNLRYGRTAHDLDRERIVLVEREATFLPTVGLSPSFDEYWMLNGCTSRNNHNFTKYHPGTKQKEELFFPSTFNDQVNIFVSVAERVGWDDIIVEIPDTSETNLESQDSDASVRDASLQIDFINTSFETNFDL